MKKQPEEKILSILKKSPCALSQNVILDRLNTKIKKYELKIILDSLKREGKIITTKKGKIMAVENSGRICGQIVSHSKNFSFAKSLYGNEEIFISKNDINSAILGDRVIISKIRNSEKGISGAVEEVIERGNHILTGRIVKGIDGLEVTCDFFIRYNIDIPKKYSFNAKVGDKVKVILERAGKSNKLFAKVMKIYGKSDSAKVCTDAIVDLNDIPSDFSAETVAQAEKIAFATISEKDISYRSDLRNELIFTIDGEDAKDLDDAISVKKLRCGWELGVHIADVSHYIKMNSQIDKDAFVRGTSVYFPDRVIPMLPEAISNGICSLNPGEDKLTFSAVINLDEKGEITDYKFKKTVINSKVRGVYSEINKIICGTKEVPLLEKYSPVMNSIFFAKELSDILTENSKRRGVLDISTTESKFILDETGKCIDVMPRTQGYSERMIENFMITANSAVAMYAGGLNLPFVYRVHENPDPDKLVCLARLAGALGLKGNKIRAGVSPAGLSELLGQAPDDSTKKVLSRQILQTMAKAHYDPKPLGHFGLSLEDYCHFTSPIRRYPDMCVHRILSDAITKKPTDKYKKLTQDFSSKSTMCEIRAMKAERESDKYYMAEFISQHIGQVYNGIISSLNPRGAFVELENSVSGFMDLSHYKNSKFMFDGISKHTDIISGKTLSAGDKIKVRVICARVSSAMIDFAPVQDL